MKSWNVKILGLNRQSRHRDLTVAQVRPALRRCGGRLGQVLMRQALVGLCACRPWISVACAIPLLLDFT